MSPKPKNYNNACVYSLVYNNIIYYIGSTTNFKQRKWSHKALSMKSPYEIYKFIRDNEGWSKWDMELIEDCVCDNDFQLRTREQHWYMIHRANLLNDKAPARSKQQYVLDTAINRQQYKRDNKEHINENNKIYSKARRLKKKEEKEIYEEEHKVEILQMKDKQLQEKKDRLKIYKAKYHIENRDRLIEKSAKNRQDKLGDEDYQTAMKAKKAKWFQDNKATIYAKIKARKLQLNEIV